MRLVILFIFCLHGYATLAQQKQDCSDESLFFLGERWTFPATVKEAVMRHTLGYEPPGGYFKFKPGNIRIILSFHFQPGDFSNEYQNKDALYSREVRSYIFQFPENTNTYDSLRINIENQFNKKFELIRGMKEGATIKPNSEPFEYYFLAVNPCLFIGIKKSKESSIKKLVTVRFMYNMPLGKMGTIMGSY